MGVTFLDLPQGRVRVREAGAGARRVLFAVDPPNVLEHYAPLFARLKPHARVAAFEPPGFGHSRAARGYRHGIDESARAALGVVEALGGGPWVLAFPCVAAYAALRAASLRPDLVAGLVLPQAPAWAQARAWVARVDRRGLLRTPGVGQALMALRGDAVTRAWYRAALPDAAQAHRFARMALEARDHGARFPLASGFQGIFRAPDPDLEPPACPVLGIWGGADRSHRASDPATLRAHAPRAELLAFDACGHFPELEDPARFVDALLAWMGRNGL